MCYFCKKRNSKRGIKLVCDILTDTYCDGDNEKCSFYKTEKQFIEDNDKAILKNRQKSNCKCCKRCRIPCQTSEEIRELKRI